MVVQGSPVRVGFPTQTCVQLGGLGCCVSGVSGVGGVGVSTTHMFRGSDMAAKIRGTGGCILTWFACQDVLVFGCHYDTARKDFP